MEITLIEEADGYVVADKPPHMLVHASKPGNPLSLQEHLQRMLASDLAGEGPGDSGPAPVSIVNRLDRETSGLVLAATQSDWARLFYRAMEDHRIRKTYLALVWGWPDWENDVREADFPLDSQRLHAAAFLIWVKQVVHRAGSPAVTRLRVVRRFEKNTSAGDRFALVEAQPVTGRMHQIRVHLSHLGHPVVGDKIYGPDERCYVRFTETGWTPELEEQLLLDRHALHSAAMSVETENFQAAWQSVLPPDMASWLPQN